MIEINQGVLFDVSIALFIIAAGLPIIFLAWSGRFIRRVSLSLTLVASVIMSLASSLVLWTRMPVMASYSWIFPALQLEFFVDDLAAFFLLMISVIVFAVTIYSYRYIEHYRQEKRKSVHVSLMDLFILSMVLVVASRNMLDFLVFWELMSVASFFLVCFEYEKEETRKAGLFYFIMTQLSTIFLLVSFLILYNSSGALDITQVAGMSQGLMSLVFMSAFIGFGIKAGVIPFHKWLPYAHPAAPSNISALMSGLMIKVALYGLIRFLVFVFPSTQLWWGILVLMAGSLSAVLGVIYALKEHDIKRLLAYHSIENVGIILMGIGLWIIFSFYGLHVLAAISMAAALFHTLNHGLFKSLLFLAAGSVVSATHTKNIEEMGGLIKRMPVTALLFLIGSVSISALPPFNGFVSEYLLFHSLFQSMVIPSPMVQIVLLLSLALLALTSALAAACFVKAFGMIFLAAPRSDHSDQAQETHCSMLIGPSLLALLCAVLGVFSFQIFSWIGLRQGYDFPVINLVPIVVVAIIIFVLVFIALRLWAVRKARVSETWGCGIPSQDSTMEYTASGFSEPVITVFGVVYHPKRVNQRRYFDSGKVLFREGDAEIKLVHFFEETLYLPVARMVRAVSQWLYFYQNEVALDPYILYEFLAIFALIIIVGVTV
ncbi:MAG: proton-conducting transporter membrane subunit [Nanoarchaeota archaeon]